MIVVVVDKITLHFCLCSITFALEEELFSNFVKRDDKSKRTYTRPDIRSWVYALFGPKKYAHKAKRHNLLSKMYMHTSNLKIVHANEEILLLHECMYQVFMDLFENLHK